MSLVTDLVGNFSGIELIWIGIALFAGAISVENAWEAGWDLLSLNGHRNFALRRIDRRNPIGSSVRRVIDLMIFVRIVWRVFWNKDSKRDELRTIARGTVRREAIRLLVYGMYVAIGIIAGLRPAAPDARLDFVAMILVATSVALTLNSLLDRRDRRALLR